MASRKKGSSSAIAQLEVEATEVPEHLQPFAAMEVVDRPAGGSKGVWQVDKEAEQIAKTVETPGKAVRLAFRNIEHIVRIQMALRARVAKRGLVMRYKTDPDSRLVCWAERVPKKEKGT